MLRCQVFIYRILEAGENVGIVLLTCCFISLTVWIITILRGPSMHYIAHSTCVIGPLCRRCGFVFIHSYGDYPSNKSISGLFVIRS